MTYEKSYMTCKTKDELLAEVKKDISLAMIVNPDRVKVIKEATEKVLNLKFKEEV